MLRGADGRWLLAGTLALLGLRVVLSLFRDGPLVVADEAGYLLNARALTGGTPGELQLAPFYRGGYALVIAPLVAIDADPRTVYRLVLVLNALLAASLVPLLYLLLVRVFRAPSRIAVGAAVVAAAYPSATVFSQVALSENLLLPLTVVWLLLLGALVDAGSARSQAFWAAALGSCGAALYGVHGRMIVATALTIAAFLLLAIGRRIQARAAVAGIGVAALALVGIRALDSFLVSTNYGGHTPGEVGERLSSLRDLAGVLAVGRNLVGQAWYVAVATLGLLLLAAFDAHSFGRRLRRRDVDTGALVLSALLLLGIGLLILSALSFPNVDRPDMLIYGRYVEVVVPPLLAIALVRLAVKERRARAGVAVGIVAAATVAVMALRAGVHPSGGPNRWNVASLPFLTLQLEWISLAGAGVVAAAAVVVLTQLGRRGSTQLFLGVLAAFAVTTAVIERNPVLSGQEDIYPPGWTSPGEALHAPTIAYDASRYDVIGLYVYQWFMPHTRFALYAGAGLPREQYVVSASSWRRLHPRTASAAVWRDPGRDEEIFRLARRR